MNHGELQWAIIQNLYENKNFLEFLGSINDPICQRWYKFIELVKSTFSLSDDERYLELDLHNGNFGIDKQGNIKLLDF